jgi:hypothetical protein
MVNIRIMQELDFSFPLLFMSRLRLFLAARFVLIIGIYIFHIGFPLQNRGCDGLHAVQEVVVFRNRIGR